MSKSFSSLPSSPYVAYMEESARPFSSLIFILPFLLFYHVGIVYLHMQDQTIANGADVMLSKLLNGAYYAVLWVVEQVFPGQNWEENGAMWFLKIFGPFFSLMLIIFTLLMQHHLKNNPWKVRFSTLGMMFIESLVFSLPPFALAWVVKTLLLSASTGGISEWLSGIILSVGAGIYEEFLFRMALMGILLWIFGRVLRLQDGTKFVLAILIQALLFSAFHHLPWSEEPFHLWVFAFRTIAGIYFAYLYIERGLGIAAGAHALYDIIALTAYDFK